MIHAIHDRQLTWVFAHGSLMFRPGFTPVATLPASVTGWQRRFGQPSVRNWGRDGWPAPTASLSHGDGVVGVALAMDPEERAATLAKLRRREANDPIRVRAEVPGGEVEALTWVMSDRWADLSVAELVAAAVVNIRYGGGPSGNAWDYVDGMAAALAGEGLTDPLVESYRAALAERLDGLRGR